VREDRGEDRDEDRDEDHDEVHGDVHDVHIHDVHVHGEVQRILENRSTDGIGIRNRRLHRLHRQLVPQTGRDGSTFPFPFHIYACHISAFRSAIRPKMP